MRVTESLPVAARNPVSVAMLFLALLFLDWFGYITNPYIGLLLDVAVPVLFIAALLRCGPHVGVV